MKKLFVYPMYTLMLIVLLSVSAYSKQLDIKEGNWSWSVNMQMMGMQIPPAKYNDCMKKDSLVPQEKDQAEGCTLIENTISGNTVKWKIKCKDENGNISTSEGKLTYTNTTAKGEIILQTQGMNMKSIINGKYIGPCK